MGVDALFPARWAACSARAAALAMAMLAVCCPLLAGGSGATLAGGEATASAWPLPRLVSMPAHQEALPVWGREGLAANTIQYSATEAPVFRAGDSLTYLVTAVDGEKERQWMIRLFAKDPANGERHFELPAQRFYSTTGRILDFPAATSEGLAIRIIGPCLHPAKAPLAKMKDTWSGAEVGGFFMRTGLAGLPRLMQRVFLQTESDRGRGIAVPDCPLGINTNPFPAALLARGGEMAAHFGVTEAEDRAYASFVPAVANFFGVAANTTGVRDILFGVLDLPLWRIALHWGRIPGVDVQVIRLDEVWDSGHWGLPPGGTVHGIGLCVFALGKPVVLLHLAVTDPRPPLYLGAGVVSLSAVRPDGRGTVVHLRLVGSSCP